uniref:Tigger transposable element-derived protein 1-like isoform X5 n=1 Tax=Petromyzon marinus TaxID=7757 RepID=A0AAJ7UD83_PETMA|nr:tigger transposable element-derived protein 1-like isoform X5 [Petromyzon marinus]
MRRTLAKMASWIDFASIKQECEDNTRLETWPDLGMKSADIHGAQFPKNVKIEGGSERPEEMADSRACVATSDQDYVKVELEKYAARAELLKNVKIEGASEKPEEVEDSHGFLPTAGLNFIKVELDEEDLGKGLDFNQFKFEGGANERPRVTGSSRGCPATADQNFVEVELDEEDVGEGQLPKNVKIEGGSERPEEMADSRACVATSDQDYVKVKLEKYTARAELLKNVKIEGASERPEEVEDSNGFLPTAGQNFIKVELDEEDLRKGLDFNHFKFEGGANERPAVTGSSRGCPATAHQNFVEVELDEEDVGEGLDFNHFKFERRANERPAVMGSFRGCPATADQNFVEVELDEEDVGEGLDFNHFKFEGGANERPAVTGSSRGCPATADQNFVEVELGEEDVGEGLDFNHFKFEGGANERPMVTGSSRGCPATADENFVEVELDEEDVGEGEATPADLLCAECGDGDGVSRPIRTKRPASRQSSSGAPKAKRKAITLEMKKYIIRRYEGGETVRDISKSLGLATSTVCGIHKASENIKARAQRMTPLVAAKLTRKRSPLMENMEESLGMWIKHQNEHRMPLSTALIQAKALRLFNDFKKRAGESAANETFGASTGWYAKFKGRYNLRHLKMTGETAGADVEAAEAFKSTLKEIIEGGGYSPEQVFNVNETGLFWKRMPASTFLSREEKTAPGFKASKDRLALLVGANAAGDCKLKPLLVYHSKTPRALKGCIKADLPVIWRSNKKGWITASVFLDWLKNHFCPAIEKYCKKKNLDHKALLLLNNAPGHPPTLSELSEHVRVEFLPKNTTPLIQPMDQGVIRTFNVYYMRRTMEQIVANTDKDVQTIREFWRSYNIMDAIDNINEAWNEVAQTTLNACWGKLWKECKHDLTGLQDPVNDIHRIVELARNAGFHEVEQADVVEVLESHGEELTNEEFIQLRKGLVSVEEDDGAEATKTPTPTFTLRNLAEANRRIEEGLAIYARNDPNQERSSEVNRVIRKAMSCYTELYLEKQRQASESKINRFFTTSTSVRSTLTVTSLIPSPSGMPLSKRQDSSEESSEEEADDPASPATH